MKSKLILLIAVFTTLFFVSCEDSANNLGTEIQPNDDRIVLKADTFHLDTETLPVDYIVSKPDSLLLGTFIDDVLGTTRADIITQLSIPTEDFRYLDSSVATTKPDSAVLTLSFRSYFGVNTSPIELSVYELNKSLDKKETYYSNIEPEEYVDLSKKLNGNNELFTVKDGISGKIQRSVSIKLSDEFMNRLFTMDPEKYSTQEKFEEFFKGLYVTTNFGSSTMLNVTSMVLTLHYHYVYHNDPMQAKIKSYHEYPVNDEIVKVNRVQHVHRSYEIENQSKFNLIASPSNYLTKLRIPIGRIKERIDVGDKNLDINSVILDIKAQDIEEWNNGSIVPNVSDLLLIREDLVDEFFSNHQMPKDTTSFITSLVQKSISTSKFAYSYKFDNLSKLIRYEMDKESDKDYVDMVLVPVTIKQLTQSNGQTIITSIVQATTLEATSIFGKYNREDPIRLEVVYSGY